MATMAGKILSKVNFKSLQVFFSVFYFYVVMEQHWADCATMSLGAESLCYLVRGAGVSRCLL